MLEEKDDLIIIPAKKTDGEIDLRILIALTNFVPEGKLSRMDDMLSFWNRVTGKNYSGFSYACGYEMIENYWLTDMNRHISMEQLAPSNGPFVFDLCATSYRIVSTNGRTKDYFMKKLELEGHSFRKVGQYSIMVENYKEKLFDWSNVELITELDNDEVKINKYIALLEEENEILHKTIAMKDEEIKVLREMLIQKGVDV